MDYRVVNYIYADGLISDTLWEIEYYGPYITEDGGVAMRWINKSQQRFPTEAFVRYVKDEHCFVSTKEGFVYR